MYVAAVGSLLHLHDSLAGPGAAEAVVVLGHRPPAQQVDGAQSLAQRAGRRGVPRQAPHGELTRSQQPQRPDGRAALTLAVAPASTAAVAALVAVAGDAAASPVGAAAATATAATAAATATARVASLCCKPRRREGRRQKVPDGPPPFLLK